MLIKLSRYAQQKLKAKKYKFVYTTFVTDSGPAKGTVWFDKAEPKKPPRTVVGFDKKRIITPATVWFEGGEHETLDHFLLMCAAGQYILIGVTPDTISHTEI